MKATTYLPNEILEKCQPSVFTNLSQFPFNTSITFVVSRLTGCQIALDVHKEIKESLQEDKYLDFTVLSIINEHSPLDWGVAILPIETSKVLYTNLIATDLKTLNYLINVPLCGKLFYYAYDIAELLNILPRGYVLPDVPIVVRSEESKKLLEKWTKNHIMVVDKWSNFNGS